MDKKQNKQKRILVIGAGFGGLELAKALRNKNVEVILIDRHNYHTFQPLLYQVATGGLEPDSIAYPIRKVFRNANNVTFRMAKVSEILPAENCLKSSSGRLDYDYLVIATGSTNNFFNFGAVKELMMPLKFIPDALNLRSFILQNFERAITETDPARREALMNIAIVGGGPTGVELAGALAEMKRYVFPKDYPSLDVEKMRISLYEAAPRLLGGMSEEASGKATLFLKSFGVEVHLNTMVSGYDGKILNTQDGQSIRTDTLIWTAGVKGTMPQGLSGNAIVAGNRIKVDACNKVEGYDNIFAIGDIAAMIDENHPKGHPMLAQVAMQQGRLLAKNLLALEKGEKMLPFTYKDKGSMATIGRKRAVVDLPSWKFQGTFAWFVWIFVHIYSLIGFRNKFNAFFDWAYNFFTYDRAMRLIIRPYKRKLSKKHRPDIQSSDIKKSKQSA